MRSFDMFSVWRSRLADIEKYFAQDSYSDLQRMSKEPHKREQEQIPRANDGVIDAQSYMNRMILRKG